MVCKQGRPALYLVRIYLVNEHLYPVRIYLVGGTYARLYSLRVYPVSGTHARLAEIYLVRLLNQVLATFEKT